MYSYAVNLTEWVNITVDNTIPSLTLNYPPDFTGICGNNNCGYVETTDIITNVTATDTNLDKVFTTWTSTLSTYGNYTMIQDGATDYYYNSSNFAEGSYTVCVWANDTIGNINSVCKTSVTIDQQGLDEGQNATLYEIGLVNNITQNIWDYIYQNYNTVNETCDLTNVTWMTDYIMENYNTLNQTITVDWEVGSLYVWNTTTREVTNMIPLIDIITGVWNFTAANQLVLWENIDALLLNQTIIYNQIGYLNATNLGYLIEAATSGFNATTYNLLVVINETVFYIERYME